MSYLDSVLQRYNNAVDDEYEREIMHQSSTLALHLMTYVTVLMAAILAWVIPGPQSLWSLLLILTAPICSFIAGRWMSKRAPRPSSLKTNGFEMAFLIIVIAVWIAGIWVNAYEAEISSGIGLICGGVVGGIAGGVAAQFALKKTRAMDMKRLDAELDEADADEFERA